MKQDLQGIDCQFPSRGAIHKTTTFTDGWNQKQQQPHQEYHLAFRRENLGSYSLQMNILEVTEALGEIKRLKESQRAQKQLSVI